MQIKPKEVSRKVAVLLLLLHLFAYSAFSQCNIQILVDTTPRNYVEICIGDSLNLHARGECVLLAEDFNNMAFGSTEWSFTPQGVVYDNPCMNSSNGSTYLWFGPLSGPSREIVTNDFNLISGGYVSFDLRFGLQGSSTPCDGPDAMREGISLQYSIDYGNSWEDMAYFAPTGNLLVANPFTTLPSTFGPTAFTSWDNYSFLIPPAAQTTHTRFRWIQWFTTYYNGHYDDSWGLDNIIVSRSIWMETSWSHGPDTTNPGYVAPLNDSTFVVYLEDYAAPFSIIATDTLRVVVHPIPAFEFVADTNTICLGDTIVIAVSASFDYVWSTGVHGDSISVAPLENITYSVTSTDNISCSFVDSITIYVESLPDIEMISDTSCSGDVIHLSASGGIDYVWSNGSVGPDLTVYPLVSTIYKVTVTAANNCLDTASVMALVRPLPLARAYGDTSICYGDYAGLWATGGQNFLWNDGTRLGIKEVSPMEDTWYYVSVSDQYNCWRMDSALVRVNPLKNIYAYANPDTICRGTASLLNIEGGDYFMWNTGEVSEQIEVQPGISTVYSVTAYRDYYGAQCSLDTNLSIIVEECNTFHMANAFNPFGISTVFKPVGNAFSIRDYYFTIYDRWGKLVFQTTNWDEGWDGRINGEYAPLAVYIYYVRFTKEYSEQFFEKIGSVTLIK